MRNGISIGIVLLVLVIGIICFLHWSNKSIVISKYALSTEELPKAFHGYRITQVSDLQSEYFGKEQGNLLRKVEETQPDIIVFTGDLLDRNHTDFDAARMAMKGLLSIAPVYYVNGNHEMAIDEAQMKSFYEELREMGVEVLFDKAATITRDGENIFLLGLSEHTVFACKDFIKDNGAPLDMEMFRQALSDLREQVPEDAYTILLTHEPQHLENYGQFDFDLAFAGHAHGGQIRLPLTEGLYAPGQGVLPKLTCGFHDGGRTTLLVSRGLGNSTFPFRVFNRPEVVSLEMKSLIF